MPKAVKITKEEWLSFYASETQLDRSRPCGHTHRMLCGCPHPPMTFTKAELKQLNREQLFHVFSRCISDEMSPIMWRGFSKADMVEMIWGHEPCFNPLRKSVKQHTSVTLTPFV